MGEPRVNLLGVQWIRLLLRGYRKWEDGNRWFSKVCMSPWFLKIKSNNKVLIYTQSRFSKI
jgi:hypothetical protein